jgi:formiminotetrahydrofolate cyclodeaminase
MSTKLTLTIEKTVIERAKDFAKKTNRSLSEIIQKYLEEITEKGLKNEDTSPKLSKLIGRVKLPKDFDEKKELRDYYEQKHLK